METADRAAARPGQAGDPDRRQRLRDRQDVGRARASAGGAGRRRPGRLRADRPDRDDDRGLGRRGRPADQRLRPGHRRVAGRGGRAARRLGHRRGPGLARPPGLLVGDAGAHPRRDAAGDGHGPQAGPRRARLRPPARGVVPDRRRCPGSSSSTSGSPGSSRHRRSSRSRSTPRSIATTTRRAGSSSRSRPRRACRPTTRSASGPTGCGRRSAAGVEALPWVEARMSLHITQEVLHLALRDPFRIAREDHASGDGVTTVDRRAPRRPVPGPRRGGGGLPGPVLRRDPRDDGGRHRLPPRSDRARRHRLSSGVGGRGAGARSRDGSIGRSAVTARRSARSTSPSTTWSARPSGSRSTRCSGCRPTSRRPTSRSASTSPTIVAERAARAADFPALKIKCGGPQDLATLRGRPSRLRRADPGRRQHRLDPRRCRATAARARSRSASSSSSSRSRPARIATSAGSRSARRCRSSPTRARS